MIFLQISILYLQVLHIMICSLGIIVFKMYCSYTWFCLLLVINIYVISQLFYVDELCIKSTTSDNQNT